MEQREISVIQTFEYKDLQPAQERFFIQIGDNGTESISRDELLELDALIQKTLANMHTDVRKAAREELLRAQGQRKRMEELNSECHKKLGKIKMNMNKEDKE